MSLRVNASISKKIGLPNYSSLGASCGVEFELDSTLLQSDPGQLLIQVRSAHAACAKAVNDELERQRNTPARPKPQPAVGQVAADRIRGNGHRDRPADGNGVGDRHAGQPEAETDDPDADHPAHRDEHAEASGGEQGNGERATDRQLAFLRQLASQIRGLGFRRLERWVVDRFAVPLCDLRSRDASGLIDALKTVRAGELRLDDLLRKSAP